MNHLEQNSSKNFNQNTANILQENALESALSKYLWTAMNYFDKPEIIISYRGTYSIGISVETNMI